MSSDTLGTQSSQLPMNSADWQMVQQKYHQRWRIWIVGVLCHTIGLFHRAAMGPVADRIMAEFNINAVAFGSLGAAYYYIYGAMQIPSGALVDTVGPRKLIAGGLLLATLGSVTLGAAPSFAVTYLGRVIVSLGVSVVWLSVIKLIMEWFRSRELATMSGISGGGINLGALAATTPFALLVIAVGWRTSFVIIGLGTLILAVAAWLVVRDSPAKVGLPPIARFDAYAPPPAPTNSPPISLRQKFKIVFGNKRLWPIFFMGFGTYAAFASLFQNWAVVYLMQTYGVSRAFAANFALIATAGMMVGLPLVGFISDRVTQRRLPVIIFSSLNLIAILIWTLWNGGKPPLGALYVLCFFMGLGNGSPAIQFAYVNEVCPLPGRGIATGLVNMGGFAGAAVAQPLFGYILDQGWLGEVAANTRAYPLAAFHNAFILCCAFAALGVLSTALLKETRCRISYNEEN